MNHLGNIDVTAENAVGFPAAKTIHGRVTIGPGVALVAPTLQAIRGWLTLMPGASLRAPMLGVIDGWLTLDVDTVLDTPVLNKVTRDLSTKSTFFAPLDSVGALLTGRDVGLLLPKLSRIDGPLSLGSHSSFQADSLTMVAGSITLRDDTYLHVPALNHIGGYYDADPTARIVAPAFTS